MFCKPVNITGYSELEWSSLCDLAWASLQSRRDEHIFTLVKKCIEGNVPQFLKDYFRFNREIVPRFTRQSNNLHLPTIRTEIAKS